MTIKITPLCAKKATGCDSSYRRALERAAEYYRRTYKQMTPGIMGPYFIDRGITNYSFTGILDVSLSEIEILDVNPSLWA